MKYIFIFIASIMISACNPTTSDEKNKIGRFEVIEKFRFLDGEVSDSGKILQDRETKQCYLLYDGFRNQAMTKIKCQ